jgi:hypothetical protein
MKLADLPQHHAILLVESERGAVGAALWNELKLDSVAHRFFNQTVLDIDTVRSLISWAQTPYNGEKIALMSFHTAGTPAQNAMLKILEDPRDGVRFIILTSNVASLIPTVLSRMHIVQTEATKNVQDRVDIHDAVLFLNTKPSLRMKLPHVIDITSREDEEGRKDREAIRQFILRVVDALASSKESKPSYIQETLEIAAFAGDSSSSGKALLEYLSLLLPVTK